MGARSAWISGKFAQTHPDADAYRYTFAEEVEAREACARVWEEMKPKAGTPSNPYLDDLLMVQKAGFLREYTWIYFRDPAWPPPDDLRMTLFEDWRNTNLKRHTPETRARIHVRQP